MNRIKRFVVLLLYVMGFLFLIIDSKAVVNYGSSAIELCLYTVIPSLFPFITLSILLNNSLCGFQLKFLRPIGRVLNIPAGAEGILILGYIGGYPVGAQAVAENYHSKALNKNTALRMLGFCNNSGPAFIFGMLSGSFTNLKTACCLWLIHIVSGCLVGVILPRVPSSSYAGETRKNISVSLSLEKSLRVTGIVCGWLILFRIILGMTEKWFAVGMSSNLLLGILGLIELTNGCLLSSQIQLEGLRFIYLSTILGFGGICVLAQVAAVTKGMGLGFYFPGKILQACFSLVLSFCIQPLLFSKSMRASLNPLALFTILIIAITYSIWLIKKKTVAFCFNNMYNEGKSLCKGV